MNDTMSARELRAAIASTGDFEWETQRVAPEIVIPPRFREATIARHGDIDADAMVEQLHHGSGVILYGPPGTGKTDLAAALVREMFERRYVSRPGWANTADLFDTMRRSFNDRAVEVPNFANRDMMVFDDIGRERPSGFVIEQAYVMLNKAYENLIPVVITTNLNPDTLAGFVGEQAYDRICEMCPNRLNMNGPSRRRA